VAALEHELDAPPWRRVEATLMATSRAIRRAYDLRLRELGLNLSEASLLAFVDERGPVSQSAIAKRIGMGRASAGSLIDAMERRGLLARSPHEADRRVWLVQATAAGQEVLAEVNAVDACLRDELRRGISRAERRQLAETLVRLQENLARVLGPEQT
jgi:DNA-binding MarR family transcriptional regulator